MPCSIIVGGQYGSEGKGKVVALLAQCDNPWVVRCGGPNSGHTVTIDKKEKVFRQLPVGMLNSKSTLCVSAGCAINERVFLEELSFLNISPKRIIVDPRSILIEEDDCRKEQSLVKSIASTSSGIGSALVRRMSRSAPIRFITDSNLLHNKVRIESVAPLIHKQIKNDGNVIIEGTQGFGLSLLHGPDYPFVTARDTTASAFAMEVGISPLDINNIIMVIRTFPIRVGGNSGPLANEISWDEVKRIGNAPKIEQEYTSVTNRLRRVGLFDIEFIKKACQYNKPTSLAIMGMDRLDYKNYNITNFYDLTNKVKNFIKYVEENTGVMVDMVGTGPSTNSIIDVKAMRTGV